MQADTPLHPFIRRSILFSLSSWLHVLPLIGGILGARYAILAIRAIRQSGGAWRGESTAFKSLLAGILGAILSGSTLALAIIVYQPFNSTNERRNEDAVRKSEIQIAYEAVRAYADHNEGNLPETVDELLYQGFLQPRNVASYRNTDGSYSLRILATGNWNTHTEPQHVLCIEATRPNASGRLPRVYMDGRFEYITPK